jgi:hypothetical protein
VKIALSKAVRLFSEELLEGLGQLKNSVPPSGLEPSTFRLLA